MSYVKNIWVNGDVITASKLNNMENGIEEANGYDLVIRLNSHNLIHVTGATLINGTFAACETKALAKQPLNILVYGVFSDNDYPYTNTFGVLNCYFDNYMYNENEHAIRICISSRSMESEEICVRYISLYRTGTFDLGTVRYITTTTS